MKFWIGIICGYLLYSLIYSIAFNSDKPFYFVFYSSTILPFYLLNDLIQNKLKFGRDK